MAARRIGGVGKPGEGPVLAAPPRGTPSTEGAPAPAGRFGPMVGEAVVERLEGLDALDQVTDRVAPPLEQVLSRPPLRDALTGRWLGHPVHPMSAIAPLGFWFGATTLDLLGGRRERWPPVAWPAWASVRTPDGGAGASEWIYTAGAERRVGAVHALTSKVATGLFALSWWSRLRGRRGRGVLLGLVGSSVAGVGGYLGGHLAYRLGVGVNTTAFQAGPKWTAVLDAAALARSGPRPYGPAGRCWHSCGGVKGWWPWRAGARTGAAPCPTVSSRATACAVRGTAGCSAWTTAVMEGPPSMAQPVYETRIRDGRIEVRRAERVSLRRNPQGAESTGTEAG